jgi:hypothetical protein
MARNNTIDTTLERETFLLELFRRQPDISRGEAQESFKAKFGSALNARLFNQLRDQAQAEAEASVEVEVTPEPVEVEEDVVELLRASARAAESVGSTNASPKTKAGKGPRLKHVFVEAPKEQLELLERVVAQFQEAGLANLRVDYGTDRWMVFAVESR